MEKDQQQLKLFEKMMDEFNTHFQQFIRTAGRGPLLKKMEYHLGWRDISLELVNLNSGKRSRPILCLLSNLLFSSEYCKVFPVASAIEIIHNFSLIFDDIQDHDPLRRGKPSIWSMWGVDEAINVGSSMQSLIHKSINQMSKHINAESVLDISNYISDSMLKLCEGQQLDIEMTKGSGYINLTQYLEMVQKKTATLFEAATYLGAVCAHTNADNIDLCRGFGENLGIAFQLFDDATGIWGKKVNGFDKSCSDLANRKKTYPIIFIHSRCDGVLEQSLIQEYYAANTLTEKHITALHQLFQEKKALHATLEAGQQYLKSAFDMLRKIDGDEAIKQSVEGWVTKVVNKQLSSLGELEKSANPLMSISTSH